MHIKGFFALHERLQLRGVKAVLILEAAFAIELKLFLHYSLAFSPTCRFSRFIKNYKENWFN